MTRAGEIDGLLDALMATPWVVYTKHCLDHTGTVVDYPARHTHRIAITNARLLAMDDQHVTVRCRDYRDGDRHETLRLHGQEFVRRFLHLLPKGLMRIRHFGFLANRTRQQKLAQSRRALVLAESVAAQDPQALRAQAAGPLCPQCHQGTLYVSARLAPRRPRCKPPDPRH